MMNILIVDDDSVYRDMMCYAADKLGHSHQCIDTPEGAIPLLPHADMVLMDWEMPAMSGLDFVKVARSHGVEIPIIMVTVKDSYDDLHQAMDAGADDFMSKPFNVKELMFRIDQAARKLQK